MLQVEIVMDLLQPHVIAIVADAWGGLLGGLPALEGEAGHVGVLLQELLLHGPLLPVLRIVLRQHHQGLILLQLLLPLQSLGALPLELLGRVVLAESVLRVGSVAGVGLLAVAASVADAVELLGVAPADLVEGSHVLGGPWPFPLIFSRISVPPALEVVVDDVGFEGVLGGVDGGGEGLSVLRTQRRQLVLLERLRQQRRPVPLRRLSQILSFIGESQFDLWVLVLLSLEGNLPLAEGSSLLSIVRIPGHSLEVGVSGADPPGA